MFSPVFSSVAAPPPPSCDPIFAIVVGTRIDAWKPLSSLTAASCDTRAHAHCFVSISRSHRQIPRITQTPNAIQLGLGSSRTPEGTTHVEFPRPAPRVLPTLSPPAHRKQTKNKTYLCVRAPARASRDVPRDTDASNRADAAHRPSASRRCSRAKNHPRRPAPRRGNRRDRRHVDASVFFFSLSASPNGSRPRVSLAGFRALRSPACRALLREGIRRGFPSSSEG